MAWFKTSNRKPVEAGMYLTAIEFECLGESEFIYMCLHYYPDQDKWLKTGDAPDYWQHINKIKE